MDKLWEDLEVIGTIQITDRKLVTDMHPDADEAPRCFGMKTPFSNRCPYKYPVVSLLKRTYFC